MGSRFLGLGLGKSTGFIPKGLGGTSRLGVPWELFVLGGLSKAARVGDGNLTGDVNLPGDVFDLATRDCDVGVLMVILGRPVGGMGKTLSRGDAV